MHYWVLVILTFYTALLLGEFRAEVRGEATIIGCYIRGWDGIDDGRCG